MDWVQGRVVETILPSVELPVLGMAVKFYQTHPLSSPPTPRNRADEKPAGLEGPPTCFGGAGGVLREPTGMSEWVVTVCIIVRKLCYQGWRF